MGRGCAVSANRSTPIHHHPPSRQARALQDRRDFVVMKDHGLSEILTADHRFEQAGFKALLA